MFFIWLYFIISSQFLLTVSFIHELRNITVIYKPNSFIYHLCQTTYLINSKRIRWHYESIYNSSQATDLHCKDLQTNSNCFDFYYGSSMSLLVVKEPDIFMGKYTCHIHMNSTYEIQSNGWIDVKLPLNENDDDDDEQSSEIFSENHLGQLARYYQVPFIINENYGKRVELGGIFQSKCQSVESLYSINFLWIHLKNSSQEHKTIQIIEHDGNRIFIDENQFSSTLAIHSIDLSDSGDYICIASNALGRSYSTKRSLIISERMILPRIHSNLFNNHSHFDLLVDPIEQLVCLADGYPPPEVTWHRVYDSSLLTRNQSHASLNLTNVTHQGLNEFICQAQNKHGFTRIFLTILVSNTQLKPILNYNHIQSRSVVLNWEISGKYLHDFDYFLIYYRYVNNFQINEWFYRDDYQQILIYPRYVNNQFTYRMIDLLPYTKYEFIIQGYINGIPTNYSNKIFFQTFETLPDKIENLRGYILNQTSVVIHWSPPNSTNAPHFYYVLYYTTNTSIPFDQWSHLTIKINPFVILSLLITNDFQLYLRIASVNSKGYTLSDFYIINSNLSNDNLSLPKINRFQCLINEENPQIISLRWLTKLQSNISILNYNLYYSDLTNDNKNFIQLFTIPINHYSLNISLLNLNSNFYHILRLYLTISNQNQYQLPSISTEIYCFFSSKFGKNMSLIFILSELIT